MGPGIGIGKERALRLLQWAAQVPTRSHSIYEEEAEETTNTVSDMEKTSALSSGSEAEDVDLNPDLASPHMLSETDDPYVTETEDVDLNPDLVKPRRQSPKTDSPGSKGRKLVQATSTYNLLTSTV